MSYGLSEGYEAPLQAETFTIEDNRLYLNCNLKLQEMEYKEQAARIAKAIFNLDKIQKKIGFFSSKVN